MAKEPKYSKGRAVAATTLGVYHSAGAAKQGKKLRATGRSFGEGYLGNIAGTLAGSALTRGSAAGAIGGNVAGGLAGNYHAFRTNNRKGYYKKQTVKKSDTTSAFGVDHA